MAAFAYNHSYTYACTCTCTATGTQIYKTDATDVTAGGFDVVEFLGSAAEPPADEDLDVEAVRPRNESLVTALLSVACTAHRAPSVARRLRPRGREQTGAINFRSQR